jgi:hypothetical protein
LSSNSKGVSRDNIEKGIGAGISSSREANASNSKEAQLQGKLSQQRSKEVFEDSSFSKYDSSNE